MRSTRQDEPTTARIPATPSLASASLESAAIQPDLAHCVQLNRAVAGPYSRRRLEFLTELTMVGQVMVVTTSPDRTGIELATLMGRTARTACSTDLWRALLIGAPPLPLF